MNRKGNPSKRAVEELFSNGTDEMNIESGVRPEKDKREELKAQFFGVSSSAEATSLAGGSAPGLAERTSEGAFAPTAEAMQTRSVPRVPPRIKLENDLSKTRSISKVPPRQKTTAASDRTVTFAAVGAQSRTQKKNSGNRAVSHTENAPEATMHTGTIPRVTSQTEANPQKAAHTGTIPKVSAHTGTIPKVSAHTGTIPKVSAQTGTIPKVGAQTGTIPKVGAHTGTIPKVGAQTGTITKAEAQSSTVRKDEKNTSGNNKKIVAWIISAAASLIAVAAAIVIWVQFNKQNEVIPPDSVCGLGATVSGDVALLSKDAHSYLTDARYSVRFTFYEEPEIVCSTTEITVGELLDKLGITVDEMKRMSVSKEDSVTEDCTIDIKTLSYASAEETEAIPYETSYIDVQTIPKGSTKVYRDGVNGVKTYTYKCLLVNGVEESRELVGEAVTSNPSDRVLYRGVGGTVTSYGQTYSYSYYIDVSATAYCIVGTTATGRPTSESVMAVDPRVIKLGTACIVQGSSGDFGYRIAADTGGDIKGNKIDLWMPEGSYPGGFGWRPMRVYILG